MGLDRAQWLGEKLLYHSDALRHDVGSLGALGQGILQHPQLHIDALVEAGVLEEDKTVLIGERRTYRVIPPHTHDWRVQGGSFGQLGRVGLCCACGETLQVPNRLPIEVPDA